MQSEEAVTPSLLGILGGIAPVSECWSFRNDYKRKKNDPSYSKRNVVNYASRGGRGGGAMSSLTSQMPRRIRELGAVIHGQSKKLEQWISLTCVSKLLITLKKKEQGTMNVDSEVTANSQADVETKTVLILLHLRKSTTATPNAFIKSILLHSLIDIRHEPAPV